MGVQENLAQASTLYTARDAKYSDTHKHHGLMLATLFPNGVTLRNSEEFARFLTIGMCVIKLSRYANCIQKGGHEDSALDLINYAAILLDQTERGDR